MEWNMNSAVSAKKRAILDTAFRAGMYNRLQPSQSCRNSYSWSCLKLPLSASSRACPRVRKYMHRVIWTELPIWLLNRAVNVNSRGSDVKRKIRPT
jgi:hypothetical protein